MAVARELVTSGAPSGTVIVTDYQSAGRGRLPGRQWVSAPGESLMMTLALKDNEPGPAPLRAGLAVARVLEETFGLAPSIKWPNDVLVGSRKVCGILCEYTDPWLFIGVGLNLLQQEFPPDLATPATSVRREIRPGSDIHGDDDDGIDRDDVLKSLLETLADQPEDWALQINDRLWRCGETVRLTEPGGSIVEGRLTGIDGRGLLQIDRAGVQSSFAAGELDGPGST
jgi:BirA family biotin operon repressor/biotin-[acetyl-CoA-carboxylase] ligase